MASGSEHFHRDPVVISQGIKRLEQKWVLSRQSSPLAIRMSLAFWPCGCSNIMSWAPKSGNRVITPKTISTHVINVG